MSDGNEERKEQEERRRWDERKDRDDDLDRDWPRDEGRERRDSRAVEHSVGCRDEAGVGAMDAAQKGAVAWCTDTVTYGHATR